MIYAYMKHTDSLLKDNIENLLAQVFWWNLGGLGFLDGRNASRKVHIACLPELGPLIELPTDKEAKEDGDVNV